MQLIYIITYILFLIAFLLWLPTYFLDLENHRLILIIGIIAVWRYGWFALNALRAIFYRRVYFPRIRERANKIPIEKLPRHAFIVITTYRIPEEISIKVYRGAIEDAIYTAQNGIHTTIIASVVEKSEENLVKAIWKALSPPPEVELVINRFAGTGKRDALAVAMRTLLGRPAEIHDSVVSFVDGDTILTKGATLNCAKLFALYPKLGAVTTNEDVTLEEKDLVHTIYSRWYKLRFAQRNLYMSSVSLSRRVITLTGRMSMYRGELFFDPEFVKDVQDDFIEHWRIGWLKFLTGDDKSTWYYVLKKGWEMLYVPDVMVYTEEAPPDRNWIKGSLMLMVRWFGNSLRATYRARKIPMKITTPFVWYMIRDQRMTMWTGLYGLFAAILGEIKWGGGVIIAYIWWILFTRFLAVLYFGIGRGYMYISWVFFLYYNQIIGSFVKIYIISHLYRQKWTRQKTVLATKETWIDRYFIVLSSHLEVVIKFLLFIIATGYSVGLFDIYDFRNWLKVFGLY